MRSTCQAAAWINLPATKNPAIRKISINFFNSKASWGKNKILPERQWKAW